MSEKSLDSTEGNPSQDFPQDSPQDEESKTALRKFFESDAGDGTQRSEHYLHGVRLLFCIFSVGLCLFLIVLDQTITMTFMTVVANKFDSYEKVTWISSAYYLGTGCLSQVFGRLSITFGRRWIMLVSVIMFEIGSLVSGLANSMDMLIGGRAIQGIGGAGIQTVSFVIASEVTTVDKKPLIFALLAIVNAIALGLGPVIGGLFTDEVTWRWCFYINLCCGGVALPLFLYSFRSKTPEGSIVEKLKQIDYFGIILMVGGLVLILLALTFGGNLYAWDSSTVICCFVFGGVLCLGFVIWNFGFPIKHALIPPEITNVRAIALSVTSMAFGISAFMVATQFVVFYFQVVREQNPLHSGISCFPFVIPLFLTSILCGVSIEKSRYITPFSIVGAAITTIAGGLLTLLEVHSPLRDRIGLLILLGIGVGLVIQPALNMVQVCAPKTPGSTILATSFAMFSRNIGSAIANQIGQLIYTTTLKNGLRVVEQRFPGSNVEEVVSNTSAMKKLSPVVLELVKEQVMHSLRNTYYLVIALAGVGFIFAVFTPQVRIPRKEEVQDAE